MKKKVLIVEDSILCQRYYEMVTRGKVELLKAQTIAEAARLFAEHRKNLSLVIMDGCVDNNKDQEPDTLPLIRQIKREKPFLPIIASSCSDDCRKLMYQAGCDYETGDLSKISDIAEEILGLKFG